VPHLPQQQQRMPAHDPFMNGPYNNVMGGGQQMLLHQIQTLDSQMTRSVMLHNLPPACKHSELIDELKFGALDFIRMIPDERYAFVSFVDPASAAKLINQASLNLISVRGFAIQCTPSQSAPLAPHIAMEVSKGASRCLYMGGLGGDITERTLESAFSSYGLVENVRVLNRTSKKHNDSKDEGDEKQPGDNADEEYCIAFIHFTSIESAIFAKEKASRDPRWHRVRINFGKDRCSLDPAKAAATNRLNDEGTPTRSVWLGGLHPQTTYEEVCSLIHDGAIESLVIYREKGNAFVNFVLPECALAFMQRVKATKLICHDTTVKVGWARSDVISRDLAEAILKGATRCVYLGHLNPPRSTDWLIEKAQVYGELEMVRNLGDKNIAFINFTSVHCAMRCVNQLRELSRSDKDWNGVKVNFAKDRCGGATPARSQMLPNEGIPNHIPDYGSPVRAPREPMREHVREHMGHHMMRQLSPVSPPFARDGPKPPMCKYFMQGQCRSGDRCPYSHGGRVPPQQSVNFSQVGGNSNGDGDLNGGDVKPPHKFKTVMCRFWIESGGKNCR